MIITRIETAFARALLSLPLPVVRALAGKPIARDGRVLDAQAQLIIRIAARVGKRPSHEIGVEKSREELDTSGNTLAPLGIALASDVDTTLANVPVRIYTPHNASGAALVYFHGGGHTSGSIRSHDNMCRGMAARARCVIASVDYRRAPEHRFPAAADDCIAAFRALVADAARFNVNATRIGVGGDSAGGNLAAVVALATIDDVIKPRVQLLVYPVVDLTMSFPSIETLGHGFMLEKETIAWFRANYLGASPTDAQLKDPKASPFFARDEDLARTPPAIVVTAGFDPLRDEGDAYAQRLATAGVRVVHKSYAGMWHGFWNTSGVIREAARAFDEVNDELARALQ